MRIQNPVMGGGYFIPPIYIRIGDSNEIIKENTSILGGDKSGDS